MTHLSRHTIVCRAAQEAGAPHRGYIDRKKTSFSHFCISVIHYPIGTEFVTEFPASEGSLHTKFEGNRSSHFRDTSCQSFGFFSSFFFSFFVFSHTCKNCYKTQTRAPIALKFDRRGVQRQILASNLVQNR